MKRPLSLPSKRPQSSAHLAEAARAVGRGISTRWEELFHRPYNVAVYLFVSACVVLDVAVDRPIAALAALLVLAGWDLLFCLRARNFSGAEPRFILERAIATQTLAQYFVGFYGVALGVLVSKDGHPLLARMREPALRLELFAPLVLGTIALVLVPVRIAEHRHERKTVTLVSPSLRAMLCLMMFAQQGAAISYVHAVGRIVRLLESESTKPSLLHAPAPPIGEAGAPGQ
jgi:hypothetical protein